MLLLAKFCRNSISSPSALGWLSELVTTQIATQVHDHTLFNAVYFIAKQSRYIF